MKLFLLLIIVAAASATGAKSKENQNSTNVEDSNVIFRETDENRSYLALNKRLDIQNRRLDIQDDLMMKHIDATNKWTTVLRRQDGSVNFYRNWNTYENGFGDPNGEYFIGLQKLHIMTTYDAPQELMFIMKLYTGETRYAKYDNFRIGSEADHYTITDLGAYSGNAGDAFSKVKGNSFSTFDKDNNDGHAMNCAESFKGGWWFGFHCFEVYLTGIYGKSSSVVWDRWGGWGDNLKYAEMRIRAKL